MKISAIKFYPNSKAFTTGIKEKICLDCSIKKLENPFICGMCTTVRSIRPSDYIKNKLNFFSVFNIKDQYIIDKSNLEKQYKDLQKIVHPDKYAHESDDILKEAQECSSFVSNAYQTLKDDYYRANYLLKLKGMKGIEEGEKSERNQEFLEELMEVQEKIEESEGKEQLFILRDEVLEKINCSKLELEINFRNGDLDKVTQILRSIKFHLTLLEQINSKI
jgi:molecular chaperone HscB